MVEKVFIKSGEKYDPVSLIPFELENPIKKIIIEHPQIVPLDVITSIPNTRFFPISSELDTDHGNLDVIGVDTYGEIYITETKLYSNPDRRCMPAQAWDYAGGLTTFSHNFEDFKNRIMQTNKFEVNKKTPLENKTLEQIISEIPDSEENLLNTIQKNFENSKFTFILVLDKIDEKIKENLKYHNQNDNNSMYALTLSYFKLEGGNSEIIISDVYGTETARKKLSARNYGKWKEVGDSEFVKLINSNSELTNEQKETVKEFFYELKEILGGVPESEECEIGYYDWGQGRAPHFHVRLYAIGYHEKKDYSRYAFKIRPDGNIRFVITGHIKEEAKEFGERFTQELRKIPCAKELVKSMDEGRKEPV